MFARILVPLDGSTFAERALPHAELIAQIFDATIVLLRVLEPTTQHDKPEGVDPLTWQIRKNEAELYLQEMVKQVENRIIGKSIDERGDLARSKRVEYAIREGRTPENIVNFAQSENIDLLIISTHGWGGFTRWNISSVAEKVLKMIYKPVLLVRAYEEIEEINHNVHYNRILVPVDSSRRAECVFAAAISLAREALITKDSPSMQKIANESILSAERSQPCLILATVIRPPELPIPEPYSEDIHQLVSQILQFSHQFAQDYLHRIKEQMTVDSETFVLQNRSVSSALHDLAEQQAVDLIIMSAHGYTGQNIHPYGSITREIMELGSKPILIIQDISPAEVNLTDSERAGLRMGAR